MASGLARDPDRIDRLTLARTLGVSPRRLLGWEPTTTQYGFDADGERCPIADAWEIVTETEPEWSDDDRAQMRALSTYESQVCGCGFHESLLDPATNFYKFGERKCPVCASSEQYGRVLHEHDTKAAEHAGDAPASTPKPSDGRKVFLRRMTPQEVAEHNASA